MGYGEITPRVERRLFTDTTTVQYAGFGEWLPLAGVTTIKAVIKYLAVSITGGNSMSVQLAYQTAATRTDKPSAWQTLGASATTFTDDGKFCTGEETPTVTGKSFIRFGIAYAMTGSGTGQACVSLQTSYDATGSILGGKSLLLTATTTSDQFATVTGWLPVLKADHLRYAVIVSTISGASFRWRPTYQTAEEEPEEPDDWLTSWGSGYNTQGEGEYVVDSLDSSGVAGKMWIRFGLQYSLSAAGMAQAELSVAVLGWK